MMIWTGAATVENSMESSQKNLKQDYHVTQQCHSWVYPRKTKTLIQKDTCTPMFIAALFKIAKIWKQPKCQQMNR